jgi:hypothetical protein
VRLPLDLPRRRELSAALALVVASAALVLVGAAPASAAIPRAKISAHPAKRTDSQRARFAFSAGGASDFQCSLDGYPFVACVSPLTIHVGEGRHVFRVRGVAIGAHGPPATFAWRVG